MEPSPARLGRIFSLDVLRGLVMALMALDHCRDFLASGPDLLAALDPATTTPLRFSTRFITHICAPAFVFLAGVGVHLSLARQGDVRRKSLALLARGLVLILLELTLVRLAWFFGWDTELVFLQVIWALGVSMLVMAGLVFTPDWFKVVFGLALVAGHNLFDHISPNALGALDGLWRLAHAGGSFSLGSGVRVAVVYPLLPWIGVMPLGAAAGRIWTMAPRRRTRLLILAGWSCLAAFAALRFFGLYGEPSSWLHFPEASRTAYSFLNVTKYPPSLQFLLLTLGMTSLALAWAERDWGRLGRWLATYGRVPLFFYVLHLFLAHALGVAVAFLRHGRAEWLFTLPYISRPAPGLGVGLGWVLLAWGVCLAALYWPCRYYGKLRENRGSWWASLF